MAGPNIRLYYLDNLRVFLTALVILHHAIEPWATGGGRVPVAGQFMGWALILGINASFFMGLFFFLAGYFTPSSLQRKGPGAFARGRLIRLGLPALFYGIFINPLLSWMLGSQLGLPPAPYLDYWLSYLVNHFNYAHLWFVVLLLELSLIYALYCALRGGSALSTVSKAKLSQKQVHLGLLGIVVSLTVLTFLIRIWWPINQWFNLAGLFMFEPAHVPQYVLLFVLGIMARENGWLTRLSAKVGGIWCGLAFAPTFIFGAVWLEDSFLGHGFTWINLVASMREAFMCVGICAGLLVWFEKRHNDNGGLWPWLARGAYTVYIIHIPLVVIVQVWLRELSPFTGAPLTVLITIPACWLAANYLVRRIPKIKTVLG